MGQRSIKSINALMLFPKEKRILASQEHTFKKYEGWAGDSEEKSYYLEHQKCLRERERERDLTGMEK